MNSLRVDARIWIMTAVYAVILGGLYHSTLSWLVLHDWPREDYSYAYFMPLLVAYLVWTRKDRFLRVPSSASWYGLFALIPGIALFWLGELSGEFFSLYLSLWLIVTGLLWMHLGWQRLKTLSFPIGFSLFMFPLPNFLNTQVSMKLKLVSSWLGVWLMQIYGLSAYREGNVIDLGFTQLQVVDACSGLRYLIPLILLGVLFAYFFKGSLWKKAVLVISTVPISIITNSLRIALTGILSEIWGTKAAEGFFHDFSGWFIFMISFGLLLVEMQLLRALPSRPGTPDTQEESGDRESAGRLNRTDVTREPAHDLSGEKTASLSFSPVHFTAAVIVLAVTLVLSQGIDFREKTPITESFEKFPMKIENWEGTRGSLEQKFIDSLDLSDYIMADYTDGSEKTVNLYVAYYESQTKGESIHSPATCMPGGGWVFVNSGRYDLPLLSDRKESMPVNRVLMQKAGIKQLVYYWFDQRGRILTSAYELKLFNFLDALTRQRTDGALVRIITPVYESEALLDAENRLLRFTGDVIPVLSEFIPQ